MRLMLTKSIITIYILNSLTSHNDFRSCKSLSERVSPYDTTSGKQTHIARFEKSWGKKSLYVVENILKQKKNNK